MLRNWKRKEESDHHYEEYTAKVGEKRSTLITFKKGKVRWRSGAEVK